MRTIVSGIPTPPRHSDHAAVLSSDFSGSRTLTLAEPTPYGRTAFVLTAGVIDKEAEDFFGRSQCHWLAGAIHSLTGWPLSVVDIGEGDDGWQAVHTAAITPRATLLDIFGEHHEHEMRQGYFRIGASRVRLRRVSGADLPGDVVTDIGDLSGNPLWWTEAVFTTPDLQGLLLHFARLLLRRHGFGSFISPSATGQP